MNATEYQKLAARTLIDKPDFELGRDEIRLLWEALELAVSATKIVEYLKKGLLHQHGIDSETLGDLIKAVLSQVEYIQSAYPFGFVPYGVSDENLMLLWNACGLIGESGEITNEILQTISQHEPTILAKEIGDCSWYIAALCSKLNLDLGDVLEANINKLRTRYPAGYNSQDSQNRVDVL